MKCTEKACPSPAVHDGLCRYHLAWRTMPVSLGGKGVAFGEISYDRSLNRLVYFDQVNKDLKHFRKARREAELARARFTRDLENIRRASGRFTWREIHGFHGVIRMVDGERWHSARMKPTTAASPTLGA